MTRKSLVFLALALLASSCAPSMSRTVEGGVIAVAHRADEFSAALEYALELCVERKMNIRHISTEPGADAGSRISRFECVKK